MNVFLFLFILFALILIGVAFLFYLHLKRVTSQMVSLKEQLQLMITDPTTPNDMSKQPEDVIDLHEQNNYQVPADVKLEIEGGEMNVPPEYTETN